jgi:hypothetical protein
MLSRFYFWRKPIVPISKKLEEISPIDLERGEKKT